MIQTNKWAFIALIALTFTGCHHEGGYNKQQVGSVVGGAIGGVLGSNLGDGKGRTAAIIGGTMLGAFAGSNVGASLDRADQLYMQQTQTKAYEAPVNQTIAWNNPESGHAGTVTPVREGTATNGNYCREFQQTITIDGSTERAYGTACRQEDGTWRIIN